MTKTNLELIIENELGWLDDLQVQNIGGKLMLAEQDEELPFNVSHVFEETEFVSKWLLPFALGNSFGISYFPWKEWFSFTYNGTRSVLVVKRGEDNKFNPVLLVPPLVTHQLSPEDHELLRRASQKIYANSQDAMKKNDINANMEVAKVLANEQVGLKAKPMRLPDLISPSFFAKHDINPELEQNIYYIRDVIRKGMKTLIEDLNKAREIFYRRAKGEDVSKEELLFIYTLSLGEFIIDDKLKEEASSQTTGQPVGNDVSDDPLSC